jgi:branched-chain amino acid transport system substrate-binding protein
MVRRVVMVGFVALFLISFMAGSGLAQVKEIRIGVVGPMKATQGESIWRGPVLAAEEINNAGGVNIKGAKVPIKLVRIDSNELTSVTDAVTAVERAVNDVDFYVGFSRSESTLAMQDVIMKYKKIMFSSGAVHPELTMRVAKDYEKYKYFFKGTINSTFQGQVLLGHLEDVGKTVREQIGIAKPKVAVLADKLQWADPIVKMVETKAPEMGMEVVGNWRPSAMASDVSAELTAIKGAGAQILFKVTAGTMGVALGKQWGELQIPAALVGGDAVGSVKSYWTATGGFGKYNTVMCGIGAAEMTEKTMPFWDKFVKRFNEFPGYDSNTYDCVYILKAAIEKTGTINADALVPELEKTDYRGAYGRIVYFPRGHQFPHDVQFGPGYATWTVSQWLGPETLTVVWPMGWQGVSYKGAQKYQLPPWVVDYWKKRK